jgi:hypothetical protein
MRELVIEHVNRAKRAVEILREEGVVEFAKRFFWYIKYQSGILLLPYALSKVKSFHPDHDLNELVAFAFDGLGGLIKPRQVRDEILELLRKLKTEKPKVIH